MSMQQPLLMGGALYWYAGVAVPTANLEICAYGNDHFIAVSYSPAGTLVLSDDYGTTWTSDTFDAGARNAITYGNSRFVAVGNSGATQYSTDNGVTWSSGSGAAGTLTGVVYSPSLGIFCAVRNAATTEIYTSPTGATWTLRTPPAFSNGYGITWSETHSLFAVSSTDSGTAGSQVMTSPDWTNWTVRTTPAVLGSFKQICVSPTRFLSTDTKAGADPQVLISSDGTTWSYEVAPTSFDIGCCFASPYFITGKGSTGSIYWSPTGLNNSWALQDLSAGSETFRQPVGGNGKYFFTQDGTPYIWVGR